jgi:hypothetical protein
MAGLDWPTQLLPQGFLIKVDRYTGRGPAYEQNAADDVRQRAVLLKNKGK